MSQNPAKNEKAAANKNTGAEKKNRRWYRFFSKWTLIGITFVLLSIIIGMLISDQLSGCTYLVTKALGILSALLQTIGIALIIGAVFDFSRNSKEFTEFVSSILSDIIVSKSFLKRLSASDKEDALNLILQPSENQLEQYSNINSYFQKQIAKSTQMFDTNFKSNLVMNLEAMKENETVIAKGKVSYRIYKVMNKFQPIVVTFEHADSRVLGRRIIYPGGIKEIRADEDSTTKTTEAGVEYKKYIFEIPPELHENPYLTIESDLIETGYDHWMNFHWTSLTPYDGFTFSIKCRDNLIIKDFVVFDEKDPYHVSLSEDKKSMDILSTDWLNAYTGFSMTIGEAQTAGNSYSQIDQESSSCEVSACCN